MTVLRVLLCCALLGLGTAAGCSSETTTENKSKDAVSPTKSGQDTQSSPADENGGQKAPAGSADKQEAPGSGSR